VAISSTFGFWRGASQLGAKSLRAGERSRRQVIVTNALRGVSIAMVFVTAQLPSVCIYFYFLFVHSFQRYAQPRSVAAKTRVCWPSSGDIVVLGQLKPISTGREHPRPSTKCADGMAWIACAKATSRALWAEKYEGSLIGSARNTAQAFGGGCRFLRRHPSRRRLSAMHGLTSSSATVWQARRSSPQLCARLLWTCPWS
jgi:hypothetical protein